MADIQATEASGLSQRERRWIDNFAVVTLYVLLVGGSIILYHAVGFEQTVVVLLATIAVQIGIHEHE